MEPWAINLGTNFLSPYVNPKIYEADKHHHNMWLSSLTRGWHFSQGGGGGGGGIRDLTRLPSSSISLKMVWRPSLLASVRGVRFTLFSMAVLAGSLWCLTMYLYISCKIKKSISITICFSDASQCIYIFSARSRNLK